VEFFYRSVRDYFKDNWGSDKFKVRYIEINKIDTFCYLRLIKARFARTWAYYSQETRFNFILEDPLFLTFKWL
jgi:hypothetical protein